ncbi:MAG: glycerol-3-phosphate dehydrogenase/oxidase [Bacteriovorax sp.]|nr:glycerol-3-phosphate dehydrogenase/oxidase [Bacteriovorax sp.]
MKHYKTVIIGGGIVGAGLFRDLALHGIETHLIEKMDFSSQTSERSSKMLHGGIRYLENMDFALVFEALHEKNLWLKLLPHLAFETPFYLPVFQDSKRPMWMIRVGLFLYDFLSSFKNSPFQMKSRDEVLTDIPHLRSLGLKGAGVYYDAIMDDAKITLEVIFDALKEKNASAVNHTEVLNVKKENGHNTILCKNLLTQTTYEISAEKIIYALGPFTDRFLKKIPMYNWNDVLLPSKGSHLWFSAKDLPLLHPIVMTPKNEDGKSDNRVIFVIPQGDQVLVGTTEVTFSGDYFDTHPGQDEIQYLLKALNDYFPDLNLKSSHILSSFAGIRPLVKEGSGGDLGKASREHKIYQPMHDTYVIAGGKYTTFRVMGQDITREICHKYGVSYNNSLSLKPLRQPSIIFPLKWKVPSEEELILICETEMPKNFQDLVRRRLCIHGRAIWNLRSPHLDFNDYFLSHLPTLKKFFPITEEDIKNF